MSGSSEDSDLENEWVERWVIVFTFTKKFPSSFLLPEDDLSCVVHSLPGEPR